MLATLKAIIFDFIGTLANVKDYSLEKSERKLHEALGKSGFKVDPQAFLSAYRQSHEKFRKVRYEKLVEVANAVWISDALNSIGCVTSPSDVRIKTAVNIFFQDYLSSFELRPCVFNFLKQASAKYKLGLISNFTHALVVYAGLRMLDINHFLNVVCVSEAIGWRKPHTKIFEEVLNRLCVSPEQTVFVGDSPLEDIKGAKASGLKTIFVPSQFYTLEDLKVSEQESDLIVQDICDLQKRFPDFVSSCFSEESV